MEVLQLSTASDNEEEPEPELVEETIMAVSTEPGMQSSNAVNSKRQTIRFKGMIGKQEILLLVDSGSVGTFISEQVAANCALPTKDCEPMTFSTADGSPIQSATLVPQLTWLMQGHTFSYDVRILPLKCYDLILGVDWLEDHSPTWIHWKKKIMKFPHNSQHI